MCILLPCSSPLWFITRYWPWLPVPSSRALLLLRSMWSGLHLLSPNPPPPFPTPLPHDHHESALPVSPSLFCRGTDVFIHVFLDSTCKWGLCGVSLLSIIPGPLLAILLFLPQTLGLSEEENASFDGRKTWAGRASYPRWLWSRDTVPRFSHP